METAPHRGPATPARASLLLGLVGVLLAWMTFAIGAIAALPALLSSVTAVILGIVALFRGSHAVERGFRRQAILGIVLGALFPAFVIFITLTARASAAIS